MKGFPRAGPKSRFSRRLKILQSLTLEDQHQWISTEWRSAKDKGKEKGKSGRGGGWDAGAWMFGRGRGKGNYKGKGKGRGIFFELMPCALEAQTVIKTYCL